MATLQRPTPITVGPRTNCPDARVDLVPFDPTWISDAGVVEIPAGVATLVRGNQDLPANLLVHLFHIPMGAEVVFADQDASFRITDLMVEGTLRLGSETCRVQSQVEFVFDTDEDVADAGVQQAIYARQGLGLMADDGATVEIWGQLYQPTWTRLAATAAVGDTTLQLADAVDWQPGQQVVVVTGNRFDYPILDENEVRTLTAVSGNTVQLDQGLWWQHYGGPEYQIEVGLLSRNVVFRTADALRAAAPTFGGHIMVHHGTTHVSGVELLGLGQQNYLGRYPFHFHYAGDQTGSSFTDSSIWQSNWRCVAVHRTDNAQVSRNVAFDVFGHCFYLEDGVERGNELSFNLAAHVKLMGPVDDAGMAELNASTQQGFQEFATPELVNPADRAAAGFYITNGNNYIIGNAASGGFSGFYFPNLPQALDAQPGDLVPLQYGVAHFDGNSAHSSGTLWWNGGCLYAGGVLDVQDDNGVPTLHYQSGRPVDFHDNRAGFDVFANTKTFMCGLGISHWGNSPRLVNFESYDTPLMAQVFGAASIRSAIYQLTPNLAWLQRYSPYHGFRFYDTGTQTILSDVLFRHLHAQPDAGTSLSDNDCAFFTTVHSDEYTPQRMNVTANIFYDDVDDAQRFCNDDTGTLSSRNFNLVDEDGSATRLASDGLPAGRRLVGSAYSDTWKVDPSCVRHPEWGLWVCPQVGNQYPAAVATFPNANVQATMYWLDGGVLGTNAYSNTEYPDVQLTAPSGIGWHHAFDGGVPDAFDLWNIQTPDNSFVLFSFTEPPGVSCSIDGGGFVPAADLPSLLASTAPQFVTDQGTCFIKLPPTNFGAFTADGLSVPNRTYTTWPPGAYVTVQTGCSASNPACASTVSTLPRLP
ncbi:MAG: G8 domain-containing protein [Deltaproteobacteria bacterium]|nr:G8 domain-containing protein [Deltaproteobacteria bacterium]